MGRKGNKNNNVKLSEKEEKKKQDELLRHFKQNDPRAKFLKALQVSAHKTFTEIKTIKSQDNPLGHYKIYERLLTKKKEFIEEEFKLVGECGKLE